MSDPTGILQARILIVDDQAADVRLMERVLGAAGYTRVASTSNAAEVCDLHRAHSYDLIVLDLLMQGTDGYKVLEGLRALEAGSYVPVLVLSAYAGHKVLALQAGARDFVSKPFDAAELLMRVRNLLEVRLLHGAARQDARQMEALALRDPLTGLANRRQLEDRVRSAMANARRNRRKHGAAALVTLDLDGFKEINDRLGHAGGDTLLKIVAERLLATVREQDTVARQGGDEFMIVLHEVTGAHAAAAAAAKIVAAVARPCVIDGHSFAITASAGVGLYAGSGSGSSGDVNALMESADLALYAAKHAGKNTFRLAPAIGTPVAEISRRGSGGRSGSGPKQF